MITPTAAQAAHAESMLAKNGTDAKAHELDQTDVDVPIATIKGLHAKHHYDVSEWGDVLSGALRANNTRARFTIFIRGENLVAKTNQPLATIAEVVARYADRLGEDVARFDRKITITVTFDPTLAERMAATVAK
ncbi:MAG: hypothetical protein AAB663_00095 [Patescibacteria group bacterium]